MYCFINTFDLRSSVFSPAWPSLSTHSWKSHGVHQQEADLLQGLGSGRLRGLAVEEEGRQDLFLTEVEEVLVHPEGHVSVLVHE